MYIRESGKYSKKIKVIQAGEYHVSYNDEFLETLLGSCVAVCLYDHVNEISGMNHFLLPGKISEKDIFANRTARYGITAINKLIDGILQFGALKKNLIAKIFGGGHVVNDLSNTTIPFDNVRLAKVFLEMEDIPIVKADVGDEYTRVLMMDVKTGNVYLRKTMLTYIQ